MKRLIIEIDEDKCNGCGQCVLDCAEGALAIVDGKAKLVSDVFCDGLGACLNCPQGALKLTEREAAPFDEVAALAAKDGSAATAPQRPPAVAPHRGCPGAAARTLRPLAAPVADAPAELTARLPSWPIQLRLVQPAPPFCAAPMCCWRPTVQALPCPACTRTGLPDAYPSLPAPSWKTTLCCRSASRPCWPPGFRALRCCA